MEELKKNIGLLHGVGLAVGMVIGSGLLGLPGMVIDKVGPELALLCWFLIAVIMLPMIWVFVFLGKKFQTAAGLSKYAEVAVGNWGESAVTAVLCGTFTIGIPALALIGSSYFCRLFNLPEAQYLHLIAALILVGSTLIHLYGVKFASTINTISLIMIISTVILISLANIDAFNEGLTSFERQIIQPQTWPLASIWSGLALLFWAFLGWENMSFGLEEFKEPEKTIPKVYWLSFVAVIVLYWLLAISASGLGIIGLDVGGVSGISEMVFNSWLYYPTLIAIVFVIFANANSWVFGASRLIFSAGRSFILPKFLGRLDSRNNPRNSLLFLGLFYIIFIVLTYIFEISTSDIVLVVSQNFLILYGLSIVAFFKLINRDLSSLIIGFLASISCLFLLVGFTWLLLYPLFLIAIGYFRFHFVKKAGD